MPDIQGTVSGGGGGGSDYPPNAALTNKLFGGHVGVIPTAGQNAAAQLWNPIGSGFNYYISTLRITTDTTTTIISSTYYSTALTTLKANVIVNKNNDSDSPTGEIREQSFAGLPGGITFGPAGRLNANDQLNLVEGGYYILEPGNGFMAISLAVTSRLYATFSWEEVAR